MEHMKELLLSKPILAFFYPDREAIVRTDASYDGMAASLSQLEDDKVERYCAFISRTLKKAEKNSCLLELTAICWAMKRFRNFVYGVNNIHGLPCVGIFIAWEKERTQCEDVTIRFHLVRLEHHRHQAC